MITGVTPHASQRPPGGGGPLVVARAAEEGGGAHEGIQERRHSDGVGGEPRSRVVATRRAAQLHVPPNDNIASVNPAIV